MLFSLCASALAALRVSLQRHALLNGSSNVARIVAIPLAPTPRDVLDKDDPHGIALLRGNGCFVIEQLRENHTAQIDDKALYRLHPVLAGDLQGVTHHLVPRSMTCTYYINTEKQVKAVEDALELEPGEAMICPGETRVRFMPETSVYRVHVTGRSKPEEYVAASPEDAARENYPMAIPTTLAALVTLPVEWYLWYNDCFLGNLLGMAA